MSPEQKAKKNAKQREYYAKNKELEAEKARRRRAENPEKYSNQRKAKYWKDPEKARSKSRAFYSENREAMLSYAADYRRRNKEVIRHRKRKAAYGITREQFDELWRTQSGKCAICEETLIDENRQTHVDHDHTTGKVRGLLCVDCNVGLGRFKDRAIVAFRAAIYLGFSVDKTG